MKKVLRILLPIIFFGILIVLGCIIYKDYGIPWDESIQTQIGAWNYRYLFRGDHTLLSFSDRYYGAIFEVPLLWLSERFSIPRHLSIFLIFVFGLLLFYFLSRRIFQSDWWGLAGAGLLVLSPRLFADAFYNSKDIPFMVAAIAAICTLLLLLDILTKGSKWWMIAGALILHAAVSGVFISTRVAGVMILPLTLLLLLVNTIISPPAWKRNLGILLAYLALSGGFTVIFWPILWQNPLKEFIIAFSMMSKYPFGRIVLFEGRYFLPENLPWQYLPVWIGITTPIIVLAGIVLGLIGGSVGLVSFAGAKEKIKALRNAGTSFSTWLVVVGWLIIPVAAIYLFHSVLYDAWRQMFFIYPAIILLSLWGMRFFYDRISRLPLKQKPLQIIAGTILLAGMIEPACFMLQYHPYENVYFNFLAGSPATLRQRFEMDYWGLSYKQGIDAILLKDPRESIKVYVADPPGLDYINSGLPGAEKSRLVSVKDPGDADYFVTVFRWHPGDYPYTDELYSATVRGTKIMAVYRLH